MANNKSVPTLVKVISILYYILATSFLLFGILSIIGLEIIGVILVQLIPPLGFFSFGSFIFFIVILIGLGILNLAIAIGLWKAQNWARIVAIIFAILGIIIAPLSLFSEISVTMIIAMAVDLFIALYFLFSRSVREAFA